ncbi:MAG: 3-ketoacyl-ACP reductase [Gemmatimonadetes bacterium]|nr:3-ketoacyl-ACP reductase [Gemmatimonadota bacterium]|tara:strand:+ start:9261 stop:10022 length:762 start_codon:yes stop_codon:yes gene_type:complete
MGQLDGKVALITGGGTGIGRATALKFAGDGADVAVNYSRSKDAADKTVADLEALGRKAVAIQADVSDESSVSRMVDETVDTLGRLDILVNNAGTTRMVPLDDLKGLTDEDWDRILSVNVKGTFYVCRAAIPKMKANGGGRIVNIASIAGTTGQGSSIAYSASKAAIICMTQSLAVSQAPEIQINAVSPGLVETRWVEGWEENNKGHARGTPMQRNALAEDVAEAIYGVATSGFVTGQNLIVDGGRSLWLSAVR